MIQLTYLPHLSSEDSDLLTSQLLFSVFSSFRFISSTMKFDADLKTASLKRKEADVDQS
jgi:hypothetical protein